MGYTVDFTDCKRELLDRAGGEAEAAYRRWRRNQKPEVVEFVENFRHEHLFRITKADVESVNSRTAHALGRVRKEEQLKAIEDGTCPFAFQHVFHKYIEDHQSLPTWQEFSAWIKGPARRMYAQPLLKEAGYREADKQRRRKLARALQWRAGKKYYSSLREVGLLTRLREDHGIAFRYHLLADVLLRADFWLGDTIVCTYFPNQLYRSSDGGRKPPAERFFKDARPAFNIMDLEIQRQGYGKPWTIDQDSLNEVIRAADAG